MSDQKEMCIVCAWRATCNKQFGMTAGRHCPEFVRDLTLGSGEKQKDEGRSE